MSSSNGFRRCDGFAGSIPQNFINANMPVCPMCGSDDPYWLLKDKMEWTAHRIMFRCSKCGCILSATNGDFTGTTKSTAFAVLTTAGAVNALTKKAQGKDVKTVYMRVEDVGDCQVSAALNGKELPIDELKAMAKAFSMQPAAPAVSAPAAESEFKVSYGETAAAEPEFKVSYGQPVSEPVCEAPAEVTEPVAETEPVVETVAEPAVEPVVETVAEPVVEAAAEPVAETEPVAEPEFKVSYGQPAAEPVREAAAEPEYRVQYEAPAAAPAPARKKYVLKEKSPVFAIILMGIAMLLSLARIFTTYSAINVINNFIAFNAVCVIFVGMILHKKKGQILTGIGALVIAFVDMIGLISSLSYISTSLIVDVLAIASFVIAGVYYLSKKPALGMPVKLIVFLLFLVVYAAFLLPAGRYLFRLSAIVYINYLYSLVLAVALIIYTPFKRAKA